MTEQPGTGGSYLVQPDGTLKLVSRTEQPPPRSLAEEQVADAAETVKPMTGRANPKKDT